MIVVDKNNSVSDLVLYTLGIKDQAEAVKMFEQMMRGEKIETSDSVYSYEDFLGLKFTMLTTPDGYAYNEKSGIWEDISGEGDKNGEKNTERLEAALAERGVELNVVGIIRPSAEAVASSIGGSVVYTSALTREYIKLTEDSAVIKAQIADPDTDILTGIPFSRSEGSEVTIEDVKAYIATLPEEQRAQLEGYIATMTDEQVVAMFKQYIPTTDATYEGNLKKLGRAALDSPKTISIYAKTFSDKDKISELIEAYNKKVEDEGHDELTIKYTDYVKLLMSSITTVIDVISGILIAFVAISLVVSSIMIGIITYISVLERTKEIGILRAMGASKQDVSRVFNARDLYRGQRFRCDRYRHNANIADTHKYCDPPFLRYGEHRRGPSASRLARAYRDKHPHDAYCGTSPFPPCSQKGSRHSSQKRIKHTNIFQGVLRRSEAHPELYYIQFSLKPNGCGRLAAHCFT